MKKEAAEPKYLVLEGNHGDLAELVEGYQVPMSEVRVQEPRASLESYPKHLLILSRPFGEVWSLRNCVTVGTVADRLKERHGPPAKAEEPAAKEPRTGEVG